MEDFTSFVVQEQDAEVVVEVAAPQGIHIVEEAQIADDDEVQLVRCSGIA